MRRIAIIAVTILTILCLNINQELVFSSSTSSVSFAGSGTINYAVVRTKCAITAWGWNGGVISPLFAEQEAKFDLVSTNFEVASLAPVRSLNPSAVIIGYKDVLAEDPTMEDWNVVNSHEDWFYHDLNGNRIQSTTYGFYLMNISSAGWRQHYADYVTQKIALLGFDGVFADDAWSELWKGVFLTAPELIPDFPDFPTQMTSFLSYVKDRIGSKLLIYNGPGNTYLSVTDGRIQEDFVYDTARSPLTYISDLSSISSMGKYCVSWPHNVRPDTEANFLFYFSCYLLGANGDHAYFMWLDIWKTSQGYYSQMNQDVGNPKGSYYVTSEGLYTRDFDNVKVFVNLSTVSITLVFNGVSYLLPANSGLIVNL